MPWTFNADGNAPTDGVWISAVAIIFTTFSLVCVLLRLYVRLVLVKASGIGEFSSCPPGVYILLTVVFKMILSLFWAGYVVVSSIFGLARC